MHCSTRWFPGVDQGVDQGWIRVDQGGSTVDQVFASRRGRQKRMGNVGAPHSCVARGGGRTCPFVIIKRRKRGARSARGPHGAGGLPSGAPRRHTGGAGRQLWKWGKQSLYFLELYAAGTGGLGTRLLPSRSLRSRHQVLAPHAHAGICTRGPQRAAAERPHLPHRPYPLALHFSKRFGMPAINFSKKLGPPSSAGWL